MADEAVLRIVIDDAGGAPAPPAPSVQSTATAPAQVPTAPQSASSTTPAPLPAVPDPAKGMARFYHGAASGTAGDWLTPDLAYAQGYANKGGDEGKVYYVDVPESHPSLTKAFDDTGTNMKAPYNSFQAPPDIASKLTPFVPSSAQSAPPPTPTPPAPAPPPTSSTFDPVAVAKKRVEREEQQAAVDAEYAKLKPTPPPKPPPPFDPVDLARKQVERENQRAMVEEEYAKLKPPPPPKPPPPFDPVDLAKKRVKAEQERAAVDAEYAKLKPKSGFDALLEMAESVRGTIGGTFGRIAGIALDVTAKLRDIRSKAAIAEVPPTAEMAPEPPQAVPVQPPPTATAVPTPTGDAEAAAVPRAIPVPPPPAAKTVPPPPAAVPVEGIAELGGAAEAAGAGLASIVPVVGAVALVGGAVVSAFKALVGVADEMARKYGEYNPEIAQAQAESEVRQILGDMRRAQESGRELAEMVRAQTELQQRWEDVKVALMTRIIPVLTGVLEVLSSLLGIASREDTGKEFEDPTDAIIGRKVGGLGSDEMVPAI